MQVAVTDLRCILTAFWAIFYICYLHMHVRTIIIVLVKNFKLLFVEKHYLKLNTFS